MTTQTGGPAFSQCSYNMKGGYDITGGISIRDYFAARAMQGMLANGETNIAALIQAAYIMADAMLKARQT